MTLSEPYRAKQERPLTLSVLIKEVADDDWSDSSSVASDELDAEDAQLELYDPSQETFRERFAALKDMVPPTTRAAVAEKIEQARSWAGWTAGKVGGAAWITCTSALLVGLPLLLSIEGEAAIVEQEKQFMAQPGAPNPYGAPAPADGGVAAPAPQGIVPAGF
ncbi:mitochondrial import receptor subunit Tom22 [Rhodosporidiobolus nylandii]